MFRRMAFNVLTDNKDDHAKNFCFVCWDGTLAPTYDFTLFSEGYNGEHVMSMNNNGNPTFEDMLAVGESIRIGKESGDRSGGRAGLRGHFIATMESPSAVILGIAGS